MVMQFLAEKLKLRRHETLSSEIEKIDPHLRRAVGYMLEHEKGLLVWQNSQSEKPDFEHLAPVFDALKLLGPDLEIRKDADSVMEVLASFALNTANKKDTIGDALTKLTMQNKEYKGNKRKLTRGYWWESLGHKSKEKQSLSYEGGIYEIPINIDKLSTTNGGEESQQAVTALALHFAHGTSVMADQPLPPAQEKLTSDQLKKRNSMIVDSTEYLNTAHKHKSAWANQPHLSHITNPVIPKENLYSHDNNVNHDPEKSAFVRRETPPSKDKVRIFRSSLDHKSGYYLDIPLRDFQGLNGLDVGNSYKPSDEVACTLKGHTNQTWKHFTTVEEIKFQKGESPAFSVSVGINEIENTVVQEATTCGRSKAHVAFDFDAIILQPNHVTENGAPFKFGAWGVAAAVQVEAKSLKELAPNRLPQTEIRPSYHKRILPKRRQLEKAIASDDASTLEKIINFFGLSNIRFRFPDIEPKQSRKLASQLRNINEAYFSPKEVAIKAFIAQHPNDSVGKLEEQDIAKLVEIMATPMGLDDLITTKVSKAIGRPAANNGRPLVSSVELDHHCIPVPDTKSDGTKTINTPRWMGLFDADKTLGKFGLNIYNMFKIHTSHWREGFAGAEALGQLFSDKLADFVDLSMHHSTLRTFVRKVGDKLVMLNGFETADPMEKNAIAMSTLFTEEDGSFRIKVRFRDRLTSQKLDVLPIPINDNVKVNYKDVYDDLTINLSEDERTEVNGVLVNLYKEWNKLSATTPANLKSRILKQLVLDHEAQLRKVDTNIATYRAFQIFLATGMRRYHVLTVNNMLKDEL